MPSALLFSSSEAFTAFRGIFPSLRVSSLRRWSGETSRRSVFPLLLSSTSAAGGTMVLRLNAAFKTSTCRCEDFSLVALLFSFPILFQLSHPLRSAALWLLSAPEERWNNKKRREEWGEGGESRGGDAVSREVSREGCSTELQRSIWMRATSPYIHYTMKEPKYCSDTDEMIGLMGQWFFWKCLASSVLLKTKETRPENIKIIKTYLNCLQHMRKWKLSGFAFFAKISDVSELYLKYNMCSWFFKCELWMIIQMFLLESNITSSWTCSKVLMQWKFLNV